MNKSLIIGSALFILCWILAPILNYLDPESYFAHLQLIGVVFAFTTFFLTISLSRNLYYSFYYLRSKGKNKEIVKMLFLFGLIGILCEFIGMYILGFGIIQLLRDILCWLYFYLLDMLSLDT